MKCSLKVNLLWKQKFFGFVDVSGFRFVDDSSKIVISDFWVMTHDLYAKLAQESDSQVKNCISTTPGHLVTTDRPQKAKNALKLEET